MDMEREAESWRDSLLAEYATAKQSAVAIRCYVPHSLLHDLRNHEEKALRLQVVRVEAEGAAAGACVDPETFACPPFCSWAELAAHFTTRPTNGDEGADAVPLNVYLGVSPAGHALSGAPLVIRDDKSTVDICAGIARAVCALRYRRALARAHAAAGDSLRALVALAGHPDPETRSRAPAALARALDGHDWESRAPLRSRVRCVGEDGAVWLDDAADGAGATAIEVAMPGATGVKRVGRSGARASASVGTFVAPGFYDWRAGSDDGPDGTFVAAGPSGRFIVLPKGSRDHVIHCVWPPAENANTFSALAAEIPRLKKQTNASIILVSGAYETDQQLPLGATNRSVPSTKLGGEAAFSELVGAARAAGVQVGVDFPLWLSRHSHHRKYDALLCHCADVRGATRLATHGDAALLNYRSLDTWETTIAEICEWAGRGVSAIRLAGPWPATFAPCEHQMGVADCDGELHHSIDGVMYAPLLDAERLAEAQQLHVPGYANPFLARVAHAVWEQHPDVVLLVDVATDDQRTEALLSGFIPVDPGLYNAIVSVCRSREWPRSQPLEKYFADCDINNPEGYVMSCCSVPHLVPNKLYPAGELGGGAWAAVNTVYFCPLIPFTISGELNGWRQVPSNPRRKVSSAAAQIEGHYIHRSCMRANNAVLRTRKLRSLRCLRNGENGSLIPCPHVFAFARFDSSGEFALAAVNMCSDSMDDVFIDCSSLGDFVQDADAVYAMHDLIDSCHPPQLVSREELLHEQHLAPLPSYGAVCWRVEAMARTPALEAALYEHSIGRLENFLDLGLSPSHNAVYEAIAQNIFHVDLFESALRDLHARLSERGREALPAVVQKIVSYTQEHMPPGLSLPVLKRGDPAELTLVRLLEHVAADGSDPAASEICKEALRHNTLRPIVFLTPELGRFSTVGGIGTVADELSRSLAKLGLEVYVISPYYNYDKYGNTGYLAGQGGKYLRNVEVRLCGQPVTLGVHGLEENGVKMLFMHNFDFFPFPYAGEGADFKLKVAAVLARGALETCCAFGIAPSVLVTNDWLTSLAPPYANNEFGTFFARTKFFHLIHNAEKGYEGRLFFADAGAMSGVHGVPTDIIKESDTCLNLSWAALKSCDNWGTVSKSYQQDINAGSSLSFLLRRFPQSFAHSNGIKTADRLKILRSIEPNLNHWEAKRKLQYKFFGWEDLSIPIYGFVGRICEQKGVELLCWVARELINECHGRVQFVIGGFAPQGDAYAQRCAALLRGLANDFPRSFWADPGRFFLDGALLNLGCDFGLMPSLFEPSGVVQQEFFLAGTPVVAFKTGGLKDTVYEYLQHTGMGNGFTFEAFNHGDLKYAMQRSMKIYYDGGSYNRLRHNASNSVLDMDRVARAWAKEFCRMSGVVLAV
eukprot:m51a1_g14742 putative starch synthase (1382) ;mRNA; f:283567-288475